MADDRLTHDPAGTSAGARAVPEPPTADTKRLYRAEPVDTYVATVHAEIDELRRQLDEALRVAKAAGDRAAAAAEAQARLGRTLLSTQRAADTAVGDAENRARGIVAAANQQADAMLAEVRAQAQDVINEAHVAVEVLIEAMRRPAPGDVAPDVNLAERVPTGLILTLRSSDTGAPARTVEATCDTLPNDDALDHASEAAAPIAPGPQSPWPAPLTGRRLA